MLSRKYRFHSRGGVKYTYRKGRTLRRPTFSLVYNQNRRGFLRFGVVVSKKTMKSAVGRNRIRRRLYEAIRLELPSLDLKSGDFLFVIYRADLVDMDFSKLRQEVKSALASAHVTPPRGYPYRHRG